MYFAEGNSVAEGNFCCGGEVLLRRRNFVVDGNSVLEKTCMCICTDRDCIVGQ